MDEAPRKPVTEIKIALELASAGPLVSFKMWLTTNGPDVVHVSGERALRLSSIQDHESCQRVWDDLAEQIQEHVAGLLIEHHVARFLPAQYNGGPKVVEAPPLMEGSQ